MKVKGSVALVTGGAKRIGREVALALAARGAHVAITYNSSEADARRTVAAIRKKKVRGFAVRVDQRSAAEVHAAVRKILAHFGRIDVLVNSASSFAPVSLAGVTESGWEEDIRTNLAGPWWFARAAGLSMKRRGRGAIINMIDVSVFSPWPDHLPYSAAKGGLLTLTRGLAKALAPEVRVNGIAPGPILFPPGTSRREKQKAIEATLLKRSGAPADIARTVLFFIESDFVTGVILPVDGGRLLA